MMKLVKSKGAEAYDDKLRKRLILLNTQIKNAMDTNYHKEKILMKDSEGSFQKEKRMDSQDKPVCLLKNEKALRSVLEIDNFDKIQTFNPNQNKFFKSESLRPQLDENFKNLLKEQIGRKSRNKEFKINGNQTAQSSVLSNHTNSLNKSKKSTNLQFLKNSKPSNESPIKITSSIIKPSITNRDYNLESFLSSFKGKQDLKQDNDLLSFNSYYPIETKTSSLNFSPSKFKPRANGLQNNIKNLILTSHTKDASSFEREKEKFLNQTLSTNLTSDNKKKFSFSNCRKILTIRRVSTKEEPKSVCKKESRFNRGSSFEKDLNSENYKSDSILFTDSLIQDSIRKNSNKMELVQEHLRFKYSLIQQFISGVYSKSVEDGKKNEKLISSTLDTLDSPSRKAKRKYSFAEIIKNKKGEEEEMEEYLFVMKNSYIPKETSEKKNKEYSILLSYIYYYIGIDIVFFCQKYGIHLQKII